MNHIVIGNMISLAGAVLMVSTGLLKKRRQILLAQCIQFGLMGTSNLVLGGVTGFLSAVVNIVRNLVCVRWKMTTPLKLLFTAALILLCAGANTAGLLGILPILASCVYTWCLDAKDEQALKCAIILSQIFWVIYDFAILNYVGFAFDIFTIISNVMGITAIRKRQCA